MCYSDTSIENMHHNSCYVTECALADLLYIGESLNYGLPEFPDGFAVISAQSNGEVSIGMDNK